MSNLESRLTKLEAVQQAPRRQAAPPPQCRPGPLYISQNSLWRSV